MNSITIHRTLAIYFKDMQRCHKKMHTWNINYAVDLRVLFTKAS